MGIVYFSSYSHFLFSISIVLLLFLHPNSGAELPCRHEQSTNNNLEGGRVTTMKNNHQNAAEAASVNVANATVENVNAAENAASINLNKKEMEKVNEAVVPTTRIAIIDGEEKNILVAHPKFSMAQPKDRNELCQKIDTSKLMSCVFHFAKADLFWNEGYDLYDEKNNLIEKGTPDVFVHAQTADDYWKIGLVEKLTLVEIIDFPSVKDYAQTVGTTNLYSRGMTDTEKVGMAALATDNKAYMAVYEFATEQKMNLTTARLYLDVTMNKTQILEMSTGAVPENAPKLGRTKKQAAELLKQAEKVFGDNARKRYVIRPLNTLEHRKEYSKEDILTALKSITKDQAIEVKIANTNERESLVSSMLTKLLKPDSQEEIQEAA